MCGIFGVVAYHPDRVSGKVLSTLAQDLFERSSIRGQDASGFFCVKNDSIQIIKSPEKASKLIKTYPFRQILLAAVDSYENRKSTYAVFGHTRMSTNGSVDVPGNNQPVIKNGIVILHNGIIINYEKIWKSLAPITKEFDVDTEAFGGLISKFTNQGLSWNASFQSAFKSIEGANTICAVSESSGKVFLATSNGSLYFAKNKIHGFLCFASSKYILEQALKKLKNNFKNFSKTEIIKPKNHQIISIDLQTSQNTRTRTSANENKIKLFKPRKICVIKERPCDFKVSICKNSLSKIEKFLEATYHSNLKIQRCSCCVLPKTFPFIRFDLSGKCNFCSDYKPIQLKGYEELKKISEYTKKNITSDENCLVPISGGRDSCFGLYYCKKKLGLRPVAYTYDWGFVTDLARRNISRLCGKLGVQHILVAADIRKKRDNVRKNVLAWLADPSLSMIPLFMAGDKQFFYFASKIQKEMRLGPIFFSMNWLERTGFKTGFAGVNESKNFTTTYGLTRANKLRLAFHYLIKFLTNPKYLNSSIFDTLFGFASYYLKSKDYYSIFDYIPWNHQTIEKTLEQEFEWERAPDTKATWRIGDGTAPFYNHIYYTVAGFSEHDTFRSHQIRQGLITRSEGLRFVQDENYPRAASLQWYFDKININAMEALKVVDSIPKLTQS